MRLAGMSGIVRGAIKRTTTPDPKAGRGQDLVERDFTATKPNDLWVADFTYVRTWEGWAYAAFVVDVYAQLIVGFDVSAVMDEPMVSRAMAMATWRRERESRPITPGLVAHSDHGRQYTAIHYGEQLELAGMRPSLGSIGDAYDNALMESINGIYKTECIGPESPFKTVEDVADETWDYVHWYNTERLHSTIGYVPPAEHETRYYDRLNAAQPVG